MDIISPQMWWCTLKRDGKNMAQKFTLGAGHKEKRVTRGGETVWEPCHDHMGDDLETAWDITQWINEYSTAFGTPKKRTRTPKKATIPRLAPSRCKLCPVRNLGRLRRQLLRG